MSVLIKVSSRIMAKMSWEIAKVMYSISSDFLQSALWNLAFCEIKWKVHATTWRVKQGYSLSVFRNAPNNMKLLRTEIKGPRCYSSDPRKWKLAAPTTSPCGSTHNQARHVGVSPLPCLDFTLSVVESKSEIVLSSTVQRRPEKTPNSKLRNITLKKLHLFYRYFETD